MGEPAPGEGANRPELDSDDEYDLPHPGQAASTQENASASKKAIFEQWLASAATQEALKPKTKIAKLEEAADEELSVQSLMTKQGTEIIKNPREYQLELFELAKKQNTIAVLDTGSGKTLIAVLLLRWIIDQELERRAAGEPPKISFFLVQSVTLVYQQYSVLETNLDHAIARVCGADNTDHWNKDKWRKLFSEIKVIVCTAEILNQCLSHSYIGIKDINLLIFDEAHHAKLNHVYARIIKDYYIEEPDVSNRPRIFGMTASPIDAKSDVAQAANDLESLLHSRIATTMDASLTDAVKKPAEQVLPYDALPMPFETRLLQELRAGYGEIEVFKRVFEVAPRIARELGAWCANQFIIHSISEKRLRNYEGKIGRKFFQRSSSKDVKDLDAKQAQLRSAVEFVEQKREELPTHISEADLSSKVGRLRWFLKEQFSTPSSRRCIVFVEQRHTAWLLSTLFQRPEIGTKHMRCAFLVGGSSSAIEEDNFTFRQQVVTLLNFGKGEVNCLFATSVAEEGLDVPDCNLVVRFDLYKTMIQYVQSRGRARQRNSTFIHMRENGNSIHQEMIQEARYYERRMRAFCQSLPEDRRLVGNEDTLEGLISKEKNLPIYTEPSTGAKLTFSNALGLLANFVSVGIEEADEPLHPTYIVSSRGSKFIAEVLIPGKTPPLRSMTGQVHTKKSLAKRSAAFDACVELRKKKHMNENLLPVYQERRHAMRNAILAVNMHKTNQYTMRTKPTIWEDSRGSLPTEVWVTIIDLPDGLDRRHQPLAFLTRSRMPVFPTFPVFLNDSRETKVSSHPLRDTMSVDAAALEKLTEFTLRVFKDVFSKTYESDASKLSYWLAPVAVDTLRSDEAVVEVEAVIDWNLLDQVSQIDEYPWTPDTPRESLVDKFLVDRWDGGRKFYSIAIDPTLHPIDPVPENTAKAKWQENIIGYSVSLWKKARERAIWNPDQPVMETEKILTRRNMLAKPDTKETGLRSKAFLCPEPLRISALPPAIVASCLVWPAIIHRFESYLIAVEACNMIGVECSLDTALAALTKDSDNSGEHNDEKINFQKGMGDNYERLEFIGDTFLKTATTISTFIQNPNDNEFDFHVKRMLLLCNKNLFRVALELKLYEYVRSIAFSRRLWYPEGIKLLEGKGVNKDDETSVIKHSLAEKTIADVCEAMIGAAFISHDRPGEQWKDEHWQNAVRAVTKLVGSDDHLMVTWNDYRVAYEKPDYQTGDVTASQRDLAEKVELEHPYHFKYPRLLRSAFIHPSQPYMFEHLPNYQRLEFLGDALLDMASITHLFYRFPDKDPQWLTEHKMAMVANKFLGAVCVNIGFHKHLRYSHAALEHQIREYANELAEARATSGGSRDYWTTVSDPPKCLPDIVEAFVGAMFIDSDFDYNVVQDFFDRHIKWYFEDMSLYDTFANNHPCTRLHNLLQTTFGCGDYRLMAKEVVPADGMEAERKDVVAVVMIHDEIIAYTKGKSGRYARTRVASQAIEAIEGLAPSDFCRKFDCSCHVKNNNEAEDGAITHGLTAMSIAGDCAI